MFAFLKRKSEEVGEQYVCSPADGKIIPLESVEDKIFSSKMMGDGFAVEPANGTIVAPISGILETVFPTGHAFGIKAKNGEEVLVHIGIDTVELEGKGFSVKAKEGARVKQGDEIVIVDLDLVADAGYQTVTMVILTNDSFGITKFQNKDATVERGTEILCMEKR